MIDSLDKGVPVFLRLDLGQGDEVEAHLHGVPSHAANRQGLAQGLWILFQELSHVIEELVLGAIFNHKGRIQGLVLIEVGLLGLILGEGNVAHGHQGS